MPTAAIPVLTVRCHVCSKYRHPREVQYLPGGAIRCFQCWERHLAALRAISDGSAQRACHACKVTFLELIERSPDGNTETSMFLHWKDGCYQLMCRACSDRYEPKRLDLYGDTVHGHLKKLKGAK